MCQGVVNVYSCRHRDIGQVHLCHKARHPNNHSGCWPSMTYFFTGAHPKRQCDATKAERRYHGEPCWTCRTSLSRPPTSSNPPKPSHSTPRAYKPEPMMRMSKSTSASTSTTRNQPQVPTRPPAAVISPSSSSLPPSPPRSSRPRPSSGTSGRMRLPPASARSGIVMPSPLISSRQPRGSPGSSSSRSCGAGDTTLSSSNSRYTISRPRLPLLASTLLEPPTFTAPRPLSSVDPSSSRLSPTTLPKRPVTSSGHPHKKMPSSSSTGARPSTGRKPARPNLASRMTAALWSPTNNSSESFACVDSRRVEGDRT